MNNNQVKALVYGEELKLTMKDHSRRVVTVIRARENGARVKEMFHGEYDLDFDDVMFVHTGDEIHAAQWLKQRGKAHVDFISGKQNKQNSWLVSWVSLFKRKQVLEQAYSL